MKMLLWIVPLLLIQLTSCIDDEIVDPNDDGDARDVYTGSWNCVENSAKIAFTVNISKHPTNSDIILLENFAYIGMNEFAEGEILGPNISIPEQVPCEGYVVSGSGTLLNENQIQWTYTVTAGGDQQLYTAMFTRM